ncbi:DUF1501 domain-containing protein [Pelagimonas varians]|uniref:Twin-arginine translocation pathway signal n=1 Tax=Pelagimonas varians TaxID=696760 RepID=A0A238L4H2_9RHOB|nr:DUF1501 domain-containing protein [Pelagimonas varians]PYG26414.1 secreted protein [Pelagimonas varians]SMX49974.1 hypothetical protein PEV8663_04420 [Pelagimonas varians]
MDRRSFLTKSTALGCSLAASPALAPISFASAPGNNRLVVIILRGGMDGMAAVAPYGDPDFAALRGQIPLGAKGYSDLDGYYALHPGLRGLLPLWQDGQLGFVHAVSTPYRNKRSHFDGQDLLEAGVADLATGNARDGWLNRMMGAVPGMNMDSAYAIGGDALTILDGSFPVNRWSPDVDLALTPQAIRLAELVMQDDPVMAASLAEAFKLATADGDPIAVQGGMDEMMSMVAQDQAASRKSGYENRLAKFAAGRLKQDARIASFSLNGWDTHAAQDRQLGRSFSTLSDVVLTLKSELEEAVWNNTAIVAVTEFGRTARLNGTNGTDHGTGGAMILAGGAIRGGRVYADWPGLSDANLFQGRDLTPTRDLRAYAGWLMHGLFGLQSSTIEREIFPQLDLGVDPGLLL